MKLSSEIRHAADAAGKIPHLFPGANTLVRPVCTQRRVDDKVVYATDMYDAVLDADALLVVTEWKEFRMPSWGVLKKTMRQPLVIDGRNIYDKNELQEIGVEYTCIGKL